MNLALAPAARAIAQADALLLAAGAGMGVDSGLPDFRGHGGFWRAYPPLAKLGLEFEQIANPGWFVLDPALAWGFYGHRLNLYRRTPPHAGFDELLRWVRAKPGGGFVFTSNVDGHFQRSGFLDGEVAECHGSLQHLQCVRNCRAALWPMPAELAFRVDAASCRAIGELPRCPHCGAMARPNVLMFGDSGWEPSRSDGQDRAFGEWLDARAEARLTVIELGAGTTIPSVRHRSEELQRQGAVLLRINPGAAAGPAGTISLISGALTAIRALTRFSAGSLLVWRHYSRQSRRGVTRTSP